MADRIEDIYDNVVALLKIRKYPVTEEEKDELWANLEADAESNNNSVSETIFTKGDYTTYVNIIIGYAKLNQDTISTILGKYNDKDENDTIIIIGNDINSNSIKKMNSSMSTLDANIEFWSYAQILVNPFDHYLYRKQMSILEEYQKVNRFRFELFNFNLILADRNITMTSENKEIYLRNQDSSTEFVVQTSNGEKVFSNGQEFLYSLMSKNDAEYILEYVEKQSNIKDVMTIMTKEDVKMEIRYSNNKAYMETLPKFVNDICVKWLGAKVNDVIRCVRYNDTLNDYTIVYRIVKRLIPTGI